MNEPCFVLDRHAEPDFLRASSGKQQSTERRGTLPRRIILTLGRPVFAFIPKCCVLSEEAVNTNFDIFGSTRPGIEPTTFRTRGEQANHYATEAVDIYWTVNKKEQAHTPAFFLSGISSTYLFLFQ